MQPATQPRVDDMLNISQIFGPTIQGEGSAAGRHVVFIRTYNCNLECTWCDTAYTWADTPSKAIKTRTGIQYDRNDAHLGLKRMTPNEVLTEVHNKWNVREKPTIIVVSGGEPMMQQEHLTHVNRALRAWRNEIHIETAGTIAPTYEFGQTVSQYNVSPKLHHSGNILAKRYKPEVLRILRGSGKAWFKFVVSEGTFWSDFQEIDNIVKECGIAQNRVMVMPEGSTPEGNIRTAKVVVDEALARGYGLTFRTHVLLWGDNPDK
jgi:7-carboxy-7-deazaguanine synthase